MLRRPLPWLLILAALSLSGVSGSARPIQHDAPPAPTQNVGVPTEAPCSITGPAEALPGRQFVLRFAAPEGASVEIVYEKSKLDAFVTPDQSAGAFVAPEEGEYEFGIIARTTVTHEFVKLPDGTIANLELVTPRVKIDCATWTVKVGKPKPPVPLSELAGADAAKLAEVYTASLAGLPLADTFADYAGALARLLGELSKNPAVPVIDSRLVKAADAADWKAAVEAAVITAVKELGGPPKPPKPPVVEGKRRLVVLHETADDTPAWGMLWVVLRNGETAKYLAAKGHTLDILDATDHPLYDGTTKLPTLLIFDGDKLLFKGDCPPTAPAFLEAVKKYGG